MCPALLLRILNKSFYSQGGKTGNTREKLFGVELSDNVYHSNKSVSSQKNEGRKERTGIEEELPDESSAASNEKN